LTREIDDISPNEHYVAQRYLTKPYLIDGLKFDLRIYVLLAGSDPLRIYIYKEGLGRFATEEYVAPNKDNLDNVCMHLTNYAINKDNSNFVFNDDEKDMSKGHKRSLSSVMD
jgi:tubulin polyglutamylase TTLL6/13